MHKAFDSVGLKMLKKSLERIKLPKNTVSFILSLYEKRKIKVITNYGLTSEFEAKDDLDQGEVISPLAWRIFYDPLLCTVQELINLGYEMTTKWPTNTSYNLTKEISVRQAVLAYADDTTWIAKSKEELQRIISISNEFYELNDIEINSKRSELLVINVNKKKYKEKDQLTISMGNNQNEVHAKKEADLVRHLGVWISDKGKPSLCLRIIKNEIGKICKAIKWKRASASQLIYLNNSILLPSIEYRLQTTFLNKSICNNLQRPIWILIKNKLELARSTANSICSHIGFMGLRSIWQNQLTHHFTELTIRINQQEVLGKTTRLRIREGQLQRKYLSSPISKNCKPNKTAPKYNLALRVLQEAAKLNIEIKELVEDSSSLNLKGTEITNLLNNKESYSFVNSDKMNLFILEQLIDSSGGSLLTWQ